MRAAIMMVGGVGAVALVVAGLWAWEGARDMVLDWGAGRPEVAAWAVRSAGIAAVAAGQVLLVALVVSRAFRRRALDDVLGLVGGLVFALAAVTAIACGLAGR